MMIRLIIGTAIGVGLGALMGYFGKCSSGACPLTANPYRGAIYGGIMGALFAFSMAEPPVKPLKQDDGVVTTPETAQKEVPEHEGSKVGPTQNKKETRDADL